jgi:hypothetical protein
MIGILLGRSEHHRRNPTRRATGRDGWCVGVADTGTEVGAGDDRGVYAAEEVGRLAKADGKRGRIDTLLGNLILDYKYSDLDAKRPAALRRALREVVSQLEGYRGSPDTPGDAALVVHFGFRPASDAMRRYVEEYLSERGISVIWGL